MDAYETAVTAALERLGNTCHQIASTLQEGCHLGVRFGGPDPTEEYLTWELNAPKVVMGEAEVSVWFGNGACVLDLPVPAPVIVFNRLFTAGGFPELIDQTREVEL